MRFGDVNVSNALARNTGARFSECGYATLVGRAERDEGLAEKLGVRLDIPGSLLRELIGKVADVVRARFLTARGLWRARKPKMLRAPPDRAARPGRRLTTPRRKARSLRSIAPASWRFTRQPVCGAG
jgi:hypothetical protein